MTIYRGAAPEIVETEMLKLEHDIKLLITRNLALFEVFYFASMIHLVLASVHPFADGNGRISRLVEKWFLASKLGLEAWSIQSEKLYFKRRASYYQKIHIGEDYLSSKYKLALPFLMMLPMALWVK